MAKYIIDTNTCIEYFKHRHGIFEHMNQLDFSNFCISKATVA